MAGNRGLGDVEQRLQLAYAHRSRRGLAYGVDDLQASRIPQGLRHRRDIARLAVRYVRLDEGGATSFRLLGTRTKRGCIDGHTAIVT